MLIMGFNCVSFCWDHLVWRLRCGSSHSDSFSEYAYSLSRSSQWNTSSSSALRCYFLVIVSLWSQKKTAMESVHGSKLIFTELFSIQWTVTWWSHLSNTKNIKKHHENTPACAIHSKCTEVIQQLCLTNWPKLLSLFTSPFFQVKYGASGWTLMRFGHDTNESQWYLMSLMSNLIYMCHICLFIT